MAITIIKRDPADARVLIVAPDISVGDQWYAEVNKALKNVKVHLCTQADVC